jgi:hypothetical protein
MPDEHYEYSLSGNAGGTHAWLNFLDANQVIVEIHWGGMVGNPDHYRLYGLNTVITDTYGWIQIHRVENLYDDLNLIRIEALEMALIYEYIKVPSAPVRLHPDDALWINGNWNHHFDLILFTNYFVIEGLNSLKYAIANGILEDGVDSGMVEPIDSTLIEHLEHLVFELDKLKFARKQVKSNRS